MNKIILRRSLIAEMFIGNVPQIGVPQPTSEFINALHTCAQIIIDAEQVYRSFPFFDANRGDMYEAHASALRTLHVMSIRIDEIIKRYIEQRILLK